MLGLAVSVQPTFDRSWGEPGGLYDRGLGWERAATMNPFRMMIERGIEVGAGSDSPITPFDPMLSIAACETHHDVAQRLSRFEAIRMHTVGGARLGHQEDKKGCPEPRMHADMAAYDVDPTTAESLEGLARSSRSRSVARCSLAEDGVPRDRRIVRRNGVGLSLCRPSA
jgi:predicted amidohydrolase YtcJ